MESKYYQVYMFGDEPGNILNQFFRSTLEEAYEGIANWQRMAPKLKYHRITEFITIQKLIEDTRVEKTDKVFWIP